MENKTIKYTTIDEYIALFPEEIQEKMVLIRETIRSCAPEATEKISYQMPTFYLYGNLVHFAAYDKHIGFYPGSNGIAKFQERINQYKNGKGSVQFPHTEEIPYDLIEEIVKFRVNENLTKQENKKNKKKIGE